MLTVGVGLFATFSGFLANLFSPYKPKRAETTSELAELRTLLASHEETTRARCALRAKPEQLEPSAR